MKVISVIIISFLFTNTAYSSADLRVPVGHKKLYGRMRQSKKLEVFEAMLRSYKTIETAADNGTLKALIPEWQIVEGGNIFGPHQFSVDKHILRTIKMTEKLDYVKNVPDALRLKRILLLHDIGKYKDWLPGQPDTHPLQSSVLAEKILNRLGYSRETIKKDTWQIKYHFVIGCMSQMGYFDITEEDPIEWTRQLKNSDDVQMLKAIVLSDRAGKTDNPAQYLDQDAIDRINYVCDILSRIAVSSGSYRLVLEDELRDCLIKNKKDFINRLITNLSNNDRLIFRTAINNAEVALQKWDKLGLEEAIRLQLVKALDLVRLPNNKEYWLSGAAAFERRKEKDPLPAFLFDRTLPTFSNKSRILEIGCGSGRTMIKMLSKGYSDVLGVDISEDVLSMAEERGIPRANLMKADIRTDLIQDKFDLIVINDVLLYFNQEELFNVMKKIYDLLNKEGVVFIRWAVGNDEIVDKGNRWVFLASREFLQNLMHQCDFDIIFAESKIEPINVVTTNPGECNYWYVAVKKPSMELLQIRNTQTGI